MPSPFDIVSRIAQRSSALRPAEQEVARLVLADLSAAGAASIDALARGAGVSKASVTRFARAMGCADVRELKRELIQAGAVGERFLAPADAASGIDTVVDDIVALLRHTRALLDLDVARAAARLLAQARMVYAFGMGGASSFLADEARVRLVRLGVAVASYQDAILQRIVAASLDERCAILAFSVSGEAAELLDSVAIAREYGARVIAVTAPGSRLAALADHLLPVRAMETDFVLKPSSSRYAMLLALDVLATEVALCDPARNQERLRRIKYVLDATRGGDARQPLGD
jgi:RpiR family carbohydrate utilization transcriptional regulator